MSQVREAGSKATHSKRKTTVCAPPAAIATTPTQACGYCGLAFVVVSPRDDGAVLFQRHGVIFTRRNGRDIIELSLPIFPQQVNRRRHAYC